VQVTLFNEVKMYFFYDLYWFMLGLSHVCCLSFIDGQCFRIDLMPIVRAFTWLSPFNRVNYSYNAMWEFSCHWLAKYEVVIFWHFFSNFHSIGIFSCFSQFIKLQLYLVKSVICTFLEKHIFIERPSFSSYK
jgi:hypothetical protein